MLLTNQQKFLLDALERLGCVRDDQLAALVRPVFCLERPEIAPRLVYSAMRQLKYCNTGFQHEGDVYYMPKSGIDGEVLEAIDVMLELSGEMLIDFNRARPPVLLRFSVQERKMRRFAVLARFTDLIDTEFSPKERIILLFDGQEVLKSPPVSNKIFYAVRQKDGKHRYIAAPETRSDFYATKEDLTGRI